MIGTSTKSIKASVWCDCSLEEKVLDLLSLSPRLSGPLVLGRDGHSLKLVQVTDEVELFGRVPDLFLLLDDILVCFRYQQDGDEDEDGSVGENEVKGGESSWEENVVSREKENDGRADQQYPSGVRLEPPFDGQEFAIG